MPHATLRVSALALAALLALAAGTAPPPPLPPKDAPLAVVGGGVAGLFLATLLADAGYGDITVFEAADRIAPTSCTAMVEGDAYDCSIVGVQVGGPNSTVQALMAKANVTWQSATSNQPYFLTATGKPTTGGWQGVLADLSEGEQADVREEMMKFLTEMMPQLAKFPSVPVGVIQSGVAQSNESFAGWAERAGMPWMLRLATPLFYTYGYSDVGLVPAAAVVTDLGSLVFDVLYTLGARPDSPGLPEELAAVLAGCGAANGTTPDCIPTMHPREGMRAFFESLEKGLPSGVKVRKSTPVSYIKPLPGGGAELAYDAAGRSGREEFEAVVLAVRPSAALQLLPPDHPAVPLYAGSFTGLHPDLWHQLYQFMVWEMDPTAAEKGTLGGRLLKGGGATPFEANFQPYGWDQQINGTARTAFYPWEGGKGLSAVAFVDTALEPEQNATVAYNAKLLRGLGFPVGRTVEAGTWRPMYPDTVRMELQRDLDVYSAFEELQGAGGLYYTGELLNGLGVPLQAYGAAALVSAHFS